jgi:hypothetical protein
VSELHVSIRVTLEQPGPNREWEFDHSVIVPPAYPVDDEHLEPFILHEIDKAVTLHQKEHHGYSRSSDIIAQYDRRLTVIQEMLENAPHSLRRAAVVLAVLRVMHMDADDLFEEFGRDDLGH